MRIEEIPSYFLNKKIKLIKEDGFILTGYIREINSNNILFETDQATAIISVDRIKELVLKKRDGYD